MFEKCYVFCDTLFIFELITFSSWCKLLDFEKFYLSYFYMYKNVAALIFFYS